MAADGSVIIDTKMDVKNIKTGVVDINKQMDRLSVSVKGAAASIKNAMDGSTVSTAKLKAETELLEEKIGFLKQKMDAYGKTKIPTKEYEQLNADIAKTNEQLNKLEERRARMKATDVSAESQAWKNVNYDIGAARQQLSQYLQEKERMKTSGTAYVSGAHTGEYAQMQSSLAAANARLQEMKSALSGSNSFMTKLVAGAKFFLIPIGNAAKTIAGKMLSGIRSAASGIAGLVKNATAMKTPFNRLASSLKRIAPAMLATEGIMGILRKVVNAFMMQNQELYNRLQNMWAGLGSILSPIITKLIDLMASAVSYVLQFFKMLGVVGTEASNQINNAGTSASKETKKLQKQIASFDELNVLSSNEADGSSGGGSGTQAAAGSLPEVALPDWVQLMVDKLKSGNWTEAAQTMTQQLNGMISSVDWAGIGTKIATYLDGALTFLAASILTFDWFALGADLATSINSILNGVDWTNLGTVLGAKFIVLIEGLGGLFATLDWSALGNALGNSLMGLWNSIDWAQAGKALSDGVKGAFNTLSSTIKAISWKQVGSDVATFIGNIDWSGITSSLFDGIGAALGGIAAFIWGIVEEAWGSVVDWWYEVAYEDGEFTIEGLLEGIWNAIKGIGTWIKTNIFDPFIKGFKEAFGIHSHPSTVMEEQGNFIIKGLWNGIKSAWNSITSFFSTALTNIKTTIQNAWNSIKNSKTWQTISTNLKNTWNGIKTTASTVFNNVKTTVLNAWNAVKNSKTWQNISSKLSSTWSTIKTKASTSFTNAKNSVLNAWTSIKDSKTWNTIKSNLSTKWTEIRNNATAKFEFIRDKVKGAWTSIKDSKTWNTIKSNLSTKWTEIRNNATAKFEFIRDKVKGAWTSIKESKTWNTIKSNLSTKWTEIRNNATAKFEFIRDKVKGAWTSIKNSKTWSTIQSNLSTTWSSIKTKATTTFTNMKTAITNTFTRLKSALKTPINGIIGFLNKLISGIVSGINTAIRALNRLNISVPSWVPSIGGRSFGFNISTLTAPRIPYLAKGAVIPPNAPFMAMLGDQKHGTNIEAPLETIQEAVALVMEDMVGGMMAGFEQTVAVLREILEAILGIEIGDEIIANAVRNYNRKMAVVKGG